MIGTPLQRLRCLLEGLSYLILLGIAMPLKYFAGHPESVRIVGSLHGALFILFIIAVIEVTLRRPWWSGKFWLAAAVASVTPFGTFIFDRRLRQVETADEAA